MRSCLPLLLCAIPYFIPAAWAAHIGTRVVGGDVAKAGQFAFAAALTVQTPTSAFFCGGALVTSEYIVTAALCVEGATLFTIRLGSNSLYTNDTNRVTLASSEYIVHPEYNPNTLANNIALIKLRLPVGFTDYIQAIELTERDIPIHASLTGIGWGQISDGDAELSNELRYVDLISLSNPECQNIYGYQVTDEMVCLVGNYNEGTCIGDSGSPLLEHIYVPQSLRLAAVSSFHSGNGCDNTDPSGYTRIYPSLDWILTEINDNKVV